MRARIILLFVIAFDLCNAQSKLGNEWVSGFGNVKVKFTNNLIITKGASSLSTYFIDGNSAICDTNGDLILYSDGFNVFNNFNLIIENGDSLVPLDYFNQQDGWSGYSQSSIFLPMDSDKYYFVTPAMGDIRFADCNSGGSCYFDLLLYNVIDMKANGGAGKVTQRMIPLLQNASLRKTQMMVCRHANGKDWWLLKNEGDNANVHTFLFTQDSIYDKGVQIFSSPFWGVWDLEGQSVFDQSGDKFATTSQGDSADRKIFIADFDRCYGKLTNPRVIQAPLVSGHDPFDTNAVDPNIRGVAFSPNGQFLYASLRANIFQYDMQDNSWYHVAGLDTTYQKFSTYGCVYLGPDNKIYIGNGGTGKQMSVIDNPDVKGAGCNFCKKCLRVDSLGASAYLGTPPCMPNYSLGAKLCYPESNVEFLILNDELIVYPNPASNQLNIRYNCKADSKLQIMSMLGVIIQEIDLIKAVQRVSINIKDLPAGVYTYRHIQKNINLHTGKLIITN
jgi:hypothetical protein